MRIVLAPGASGNAAAMQRHVDGLARRGIEASAIDIPKRRAEDAVDAYATAAGPDDAELIIGGQSYGGRVASLLVARDPERYRALVLLSYPLHRPGQPDAGPRTEHWPAIRVPVLLLSGEADPFARTELLRRAVDERLPNGTLVTYPRLGHTLSPVLEDALDRVAAFANEVAGRRDPRGVAPPAVS